MESKKWSCDDEFDDHVIEEILQNCLERVHSFLSIPVGEDAAQCYASLLQLQFIAVVYRTIQNFYGQEFEGLQRCYIVVT